MSEQRVVFLRRRADTSSVRSRWSWLPYTALTGLAFAAVLTAGTFLRSPPVFPDVFIFALGVCTFVVFGLTLIGAIRRNLDTAKLFPGLAPLLRWALIVVMVCAMIAGAVSGIGFRHGGPARRGNAYFRHVGSVMTPVSRDEYLRIERAEDRFFLMSEIFFLVAAFGTSLSVSGQPRSRLSAATPVPRG
jgi:hypothetical protein